MSRSARAAPSPSSWTRTDPPRVGSTFRVIEAHTLRGWFDQVNVNISGLQAEPVQTSDGLSVRIVRG